MGKIKKENMSLQKNKIVISLEEIYTE